MPPRTARLCMCVGLFLAIYAAPSAAQTTRPLQRPTFWGQVALGAAGAAGAADSGFYASAISAAVQVRQIVFMGRVASIGTKKGNNRMEEAGLLVGVASPPAVFHGAVAAGLGVAKDSRDSSVIALPIEAQLSWRPIPWAGLGARVFANLNGLTNFGGVTLALQLGRLRQ
jgi:hypothetical protein